MTKIMMKYILILEFSCTYCSENLKVGNEFTSFDIDIKYLDNILDFHYMLIDTYVEK